MNFRDCGGYHTPTGRVREGMIFRSDRLSELTPGDFGVLAGLNLGLIVDLRRPSETESHPTRWPGTTTPEIWHAPILDDEGHSPSARSIQAQDPEISAALMADLYRSLVSEEATRQRFMRILTRLSDADTPPFVFHCAAGKDRTGVLAAILLGALGVSEQDIVADFMLTELHYDGQRHLDEHVTQAVALQGTSLSREMLLPFFTVRQAYIQAALDEIASRHDSIYAYVREDLGVSASALERLRRRLLE